MENKLQQMQTEFDHGEFYENRKEAVGCFMNFYAAHEDFTPIYYRTLYRIFDMIAITDIGDNEKVEYAKIARSQLTDSELVLLRYNAMTTYGRNMRKYVVNYNLLKHMPAMGLLEYRKWRKTLTQAMQDKLNVVLYLLRKNIHDLTPAKPTLAHTSSKAKYHVNVTMKDGGREVKIDFHRNLNLVIANNDEFSCFETMPIADIRELLEEWLKEIFVFSLLGLEDKKNSISIDKDKAAWEKAVKEGNMGGIQLWAGTDSAFTDAYRVEGIPRFILIDAEGNILEANMTRPSEQKTLMYLSMYAEPK